MAFEVRISAEAEREVASILDWLVEQYAGEAGLRWFLRMDEAIASLTEMPQRCRLAPESAAFPFEVRELQYGHKPHVYRIYLPSTPIRLSFCIFVMDDDSRWLRRKCIRSALVSLNGKSRVAGTLLCDHSLRRKIEGCGKW